MCVSTRPAAVPPAPVRCLHLLMLMLVLLGLGACTATSDSPIPRDGPTMRAIYDAHMGGGDSADSTGGGSDLRARALASGNVDQADYTRDAANEIDTRFARLPNPDLVMYVYPHLAGPSQSPVPGYSTVFPMFSRPAFALPGEAVAY